MRKGIVLALALFMFTGLLGQSAQPSWIKPAGILIPYDKKISTLRTDLLNLLGKLNMSDQFLCISIEKDMEITQLQIKTSLIIAFMFMEGNEQGAKFPKITGEIGMNFVANKIFLEEGIKTDKTMLAEATNPLLAQLGLEGVRIMESSQVEIDNLYRATKTPTGLF